MQYPAGLLLMLLQSTLSNRRGKEENRMSRSIIKTRRFKTMMIALAFMIALPLVAPRDMALAKRDRDIDERSEFNGIVQSRPENALEGVWVIGGQTYKADAGTEFDQTEGELTVGSCAKVHIRGGHVHEIDSEPMRNCK
jgi:hypothetical protein